MRCKSSGLNWEQSTLDAFNNETFAGFWDDDDMVFFFSGGKPRRIALHTGSSTLFIAGHDAVGRGDVGDASSCGNFFLVLEQHAQPSLQIGLIERRLRGALRRPLGGVHGRVGDGLGRGGRPRPPRPRPRPRPRGSF